MKPLLKTWALATVIMALLSNVVRAADALPSWSDGVAKQAIVDFVMNVTKEGGPDFVPTAKRIATFDNDGTLWAEQPLYFQFMFALDRVKTLAPQHPEWKEKEPFASLLKGDVKGALAAYERKLAQEGVETYREYYKKQISLIRDRPANPTNAQHAVEAVRERYLKSLEQKPDFFGALRELTRSLPHAGDVSSGTRPFNLDTRWSILVSFIVLALSKVEC